MSSSYHGYQHLEDYYAINSIYCVKECFNFNVISNLRHWHVMLGHVILTVQTCLLEIKFISICRWEM